MKLNNISELENFADKFAEDLSQELYERRLYKVEDFKRFAKIKLDLYVSAILRAKSNILAVNRQQLLDKLQRSYGRERPEVQTMISQVNLEKKQIDKARNLFESRTEYDWLKIFLSEKFGKKSDLLKEFMEEYLPQKMNRNES